MYIHVRATPGAKKESVEEVGDNRLAIAVREKAQRNEANKRIRELIAVWYGVAEGNVKLINGHRSPSKLFSVEK